MKHLTLVIILFSGFSIWADEVINIKTFNNDILSYDSLERDSEYISYLEAACLGTEELELYYENMVLTDAVSLNREGLQESIDALNSYFIENEVTYSDLIYELNYLEKGDAPISAFITSNLFSLIQFDYFME